MDIILADRIVNELLRRDRDATVNDLVSVMKGKLSFSTCLRGDSVVYISNGKTFDHEVEIETEEIDISDKFKPRTMDFRNRPKNTYR